jgi:sortase (surface protein transpeptidase)
MMFLACTAMLLSMLGNGLIAAQEIAAQDMDGTPAKALQGDTQAQAIAQDDGDDTGDGDPPPGGDSPEDVPTIDFPGTEEPGVTEPDETEPTDPSRPDIGDDPTARVIEDDSGTVRLAKFTCPPGTDRAAEPWILTEECDVAVDPVSFTVTGDGYSQTLTAAPGVPQQASFDSVPLGTINISESVPPGYGEPLLYCSDTPADGPGSLVFVPLSGGAGSWEHRSGDGLRLQCVFFNFLDKKEVMAATGTVQLSKYTCPEGVERGDVAYTLSEQCTAEIDPVSFTVTGDEYSETLAASAGVPQQATFEDVPYGMIGITETIPPSYGEPLVFCSDTPADGPGAYGPVPVVDGNAIQWDLLADVQCLFFNFPVGGGDEEPDGRDVHLSKYTCPIGYEPIADAYLMSEQCTEKIDPVIFTVVAEGGWSQTQAAEPRVPQNTTFGNVPFGLIEITETVPPGYALLAAYCTDTPADGPGAYSPVLLIDGHTATWEHSAEAGIDLSCIFFNFPTDGDEDSNQLTVTKFACPPGTDPSLGLPDLGTTCELMPGVTFSLNGGPGQETDATGTTTWTGLPIGPWSVAETIPSGYGSTPVVFCGPIHETEAPRVDVTEGTFSGEFLETTIHMVCTVFNFEDEDGGEGRDVHFHKYTCAPEIERTDDWYALGETCWEEVDPVQLTVTVPGAGYAETKTMDPGAPQTATFDDVPFGTLYLEETVPEGFGHPMVFCTDTPADGAGNYTEVEPWPESGAFIWEHRADAEIDLTCLIFNFHEQDDNTVTVNKYVCPPGVNPETDDLLVECTPGGDGIWFDFVDGNGIHPAAVSGGMVEWTGVVIGAEGELQIIETIPPGYGEPWVVCDGILMASAGGFVIPNPGEARPFHVVCDWFNFAEEDSTLIVVKHECPPGYDPEAVGADPEVDCATLTDGVDFHLTGPGTDTTGTTGDAGTGLVQFTELDPGDYVVVETMPEGTDWAFVSTCYGNAVGSVRPFPLATGDTLNLTVHAGEEIVCHWFNVPDHDDTSLTVIKYTCSTATYVSEVDCEIEESGITFDLVWWNGDEWEWSATGTTDAAGHLTLAPLDPGEYWLDEHDAEWCHMSSAAISDDGNWLNVLEDEETVVKVYNCDGTPGKPGKTPTKYPNTGVPPAGGESTTLPMAASVIGLLGATLSRRRLGALAVALPVSGLALHAATAQDQVIEPIDATPDATPDSLCLPPEPGDEPADCRRGPVPGSIRIESIGVDNPIEILETIGGVMQQPTDETHVAWYKETARLGETGNILLAGHVNWWGVPEAVFFNLGQLQEGDPIVLFDDAGASFIYAVEWVSQESNLEPAREEVLGMTGYEAVTLMTCSGEWNSEISEYDSRTVVRARRMDDAGTPAA